jgi:ribonuclease BN (tRNA processing enzyme)
MTDRDLDRRRVLAGLTAIGGIGTAMRFGIGGSFGLTAVSRAQNRTVTDRGTYLVLLGTQGGPNINTERNECSNAIVIDGKIYMIDCGYGALGALNESGLGFRNVDNIFLTHLHDDHTSDLVALLSHQWTVTRTRPTGVFGPWGTSRLVDAAIAFASANAEIRLADEARTVLLEDLFSGTDIDASITPAEVFSDDRVTVTSVENTHFPDEAREIVRYRAVSYRFDSRDRSITISGDTAPSDNLVRLAEGSDVFVCETINVPAARADFERRVAQGAYADNPEGVWKHIVGTHTSTEDAGRMAAAAGVGTLVLTHLVPGEITENSDELFIEGASRHFAGEIIVGRDLMVI